MEKKENILVAKMDSYIKALTNKGVYWFTVNKQGEIIPTIRNANGMIKQVRLQEVGTISLFGIPMEKLK